MQSICKPANKCYTAFYGIEQKRIGNFYKMAVSSHSVYRYTLKNIKDTCNCNKWSRKREEKKG